MAAFRILGPIRNTETIAVGPSVRIRKHLDHTYGSARWRKMKGIATVELLDGTICEAEIHWYEAHGIGRRHFKLKRVLR